MVIGNEKWFVVASMVYFAFGVLAWEYSRSRLYPISYQAHVYISVTGQLSVL
jgi:hypothetical protein